jgi:hypothetical protein
VVKPSFVEQICNAYSDGLVTGLRDNRADPSWQPHQGIEELDRAYALGLRDGALMRERKRRLDAGIRVYQ